MRVVAIKPGFFGKLREVGDTFDVPDGSKASWFEVESDACPASADAADHTGKKSRKPPADLV